MEILEKEYEKYKEIMFHFKNCNKGLNTPVVLSFIVDKNGDFIFYQIRQCDIKERILLKQK